MLTHHKMKADDMNVYETSIISTIKNGDLSVLRRLLKSDRSASLARYEFGSTALIWAASYGHEKCVELLLPVSEPNASNRLGCTALMSAASTHVADGKPQPDSRAYFTSRHINHRQVLINDFENEYVYIKGFMNGNVHIKLLRADPVEKMNVILAKDYPDALPASR